MRMLDKPFEQYTKEEAIITLRQIANLSNSMQDDFSKAMKMLNDLEKEMSRLQHENKLLKFNNQKLEEELNEMTTGTFGF